jgi:hypothetical protein
MDETEKAKREIINKVETWCRENNIATSEQSWNHLIDLLKGSFVEKQIPDSLPVLGFYEDCKAMYKNAQYLASYSNNDQEHVRKNPQYFVVIPGHIFKSWESAYLMQRARVIDFKGAE